MWFFILGLLVVGGGSWFVVARRNRNSGAASHLSHGGPSAAELEAAAMHQHRQFDRQGFGPI